MTLGVIIFLVAIVLGLLVYNYSIHKKIDTYTNLNQRVTSLSILQEFMNTLGCLLYTSMENNFLIEKIGPMLKAILDKNPHVDLVLENISAFDGDRFRTVFYMSDVSYTVGVLNKIIPNRIYTLMDTCHMMLSLIHI